MGGRHSTEVAFTLRTQPAWVRITAPEFFQLKEESLMKISDGAVLIDSKDNKALWLIEPIQYWWDQ